MKGVQKKSCVLKSIPKARRVEHGDLDLWAEGTTYPPRGSCGPGHSEHLSGGFLWASIANQRQSWLNERNAKAEEHRKHTQGRLRVCQLSCGSACARDYKLA